MAPSSDAILQRTYHFTLTDNKLMPVLNATSAFLTLGDCLWGLPLVWEDNSSRNRPTIGLI